MTSRATHAAHIHVARVIELHAEALQTGERFEGARLHVRVTDGANRTFSIRKLLRMTARAWQVIGSTRTFGDWCVRITTMTKQAGETRVISGAVLKLRIIEAFGKLHLFLGGLGFVNQSRPVNTRINDGNGENDNGDR